MASIWARLARIFKTSQLVLIQFIQRNIISLKRSWLLSPSTQPDASISLFYHLYPSRKFLPPSSTTTTSISSPKSELPLVIMVHGGGFIMNKPCADDPLARHLSNHADCMVTSIDYRKAPLHPFPAGYEDVVESVLALLARSDELQIDSSRVMLCGSSAGGNLVLAAAQDPRLRGKLVGVVALYPVASMMRSEQEQMASRPDASVRDFLEGQWYAVLDAYVGSADAEVLADVRLSPINFKSRDDLPENILILGVEHDMLCHEARLMAEKLAIGNRKDTVDGWKAGGVQWKFVKGQIHAFDVFSKKDANEESIRKQATDTAFADIAKWVESVFYSKE